MSDDVNSPCIDSGDPNSPVAFEPFPNGRIINMGAYGGTLQASKSPTGHHAKYGGGMGEPNNPYLVYTAEQMNAISNEPNDWDRHFKIMAHIDLLVYSYDRALMAPDTNDLEPDHQGVSFTGLFDGNYRTISGLTINGVNYLGLFGKLETGAEVKNLGLTDVGIAGSDYVGGLVGFNRGDIASSYITGIVVGDIRIGGITGRNWGNVTASYSAVTASGNSDVGGIAAGNYGSITACYNTGTVTANGDVGGIVGENYGSIDSSYSTGEVSGESRAGGLVGDRNLSYGIVTDCFWNVQTRGQDNSAGGTGKTTTEMQTAATFIEEGWDFVGETANGTEDIWWILEGQDYPRLWWELIPEN